MVTIRKVTWVNAPVERCFKLSTSVDLHVDSAKASGERAVEGVTRGLIGEGETVKWSGRHFGLRWTHTSRIDGWRPYSYFRDVMVAGAFRYYEHEHHFAAMNDGTRIRDEAFTRWGVLAGLSGLFLRRHLTRFLRHRNLVIKRVAESEEWRRYLEGAYGVKAEGARPRSEEKIGAWKQSAYLRG